MAYLLTAANHHPFQIPKQYRALKLGELEGTMVGNYFQSVRLFDQSFGEFLDRLEKSDLLDRSIVALYGDHEAFLSRNPELTSLLELPEESEYPRLLVRKRLPFLVRLPHGERAGARTTAGGHLDISPTLLSLLGIESGAEMMLGRDLTSAGESFVVFRDGSFTNGEFYFVNHLGPISNCDCYSAATGARVDCQPLESLRHKALEQLEISDTVIQGDLIPFLRDAVERKARVRYSLMRSGAAGETESIHSASGETITPQPGAIRGGVEVIEQRDDRTVFAGWARHGTRRVDRVAVFVDGDADHYIHTAVPRKDVVTTSNTPSLWEKQWIRLDKHLSLSSNGEADQRVDTVEASKDIATEVNAMSPERVGFRVTVWSQVFAPRTAPEVRVFGISESGVASELRYKEQYGAGDRRIVLGER